VPVAKRNFRNRHKHGGFGEKKKAACQDKKETEEKKEERPEKEPSVDDTEEDVEENEGDLKPSASPAAATDTSTTASANNNTVAITSTQDPERVQEWVSLLDTKPDPSDKQAMAVWMMNLMHATEAMNSRPEASSSQSPAQGVAVKSESTPQSPAEECESKPAAFEGPVKSEETADKPSTDV
jgi:hypothetical protein